MRILVVEDEHLLNHTLCYNLTAAGYSVDAAITKAAAAGLCSKQDYGLIVLDINLPDGSGKKMTAIKLSINKSCAVIGTILQWSSVFVTLQPKSFN